MFNLAILLVLLTAADITTLTVKPETPLFLYTLNKDFDHFVVRIPAKGRYHTNELVFMTTNNVVTVEDLRAIPQGCFETFIYSVCKDGEISHTNELILEIRRYPVEAPRVESLTHLPPLPNGRGLSYHR